jgi:hypothetical protein
MIGSYSPSHQRFPLFPWLLAVASSLAACGGGGGGSGGGGGTAGPRVVAAAFVGAGPSPAAGDSLVLFFAADVQLVAAKLLDDADVVLSGGATLGAVAAAPVLQSARSVAVTLGTGVSFVPGSTTVVLGTGNDAVRTAAGQVGGGGAAVTIGTSDGVAPTLSRITISGIDDELNGLGPAGGTLQVPPNGFRIDLAYSDNGAIATGQTVVTASVAVTTPAGSQPAGTNLRPFLTTVSATNTAARYVVPGDVSFGTGDCILTCTVVDASGLASAPRTFPCRVRTFSSTLRPFETAVNPSQVWFLDFSRDVESFTTSAISGGVSVDVVAGANSRSDFEDVLHVLGLLHGTPIPNVQAGLDSNQVVLARFKSELLTQLALLYADANVQFTLTRPAGTFGTAASVGYNTFGYSQISIAGSASTTGVLGVAIFDPSNNTQNDNTRLNFSGIRLGIFLHTMADFGMAPPSSSAFRQTFNPLAPSLGGTAVGANSQDGERLVGTRTDGRANDILGAIDEFARFTAVVLAHECGHSMGLVQNGAMPVGLYGNDSTNFPGSSDGHIRNTSLFPAGATNVMSPSLSYSAAVNPASAFNTLNLAYLREQVFYGN